MAYKSGDYQAAYEEQPVQPEPAQPVATAAPTGYQPGDYQAAYEEQPAPASQESAQTGYQPGSYQAAYEEQPATEAQPAEPAPPVDQGYVPGTNRILDTAFAVGDKLGDAVEAVGGPNLRQNLEGFAPPIQEVAEANGIKDKLLAASDYWDRPLQAASEVLGRDAIARKDDPTPTPAPNLTTREGLLDAGQQFVEGVKDVAAHPENALYVIPRAVSGGTALFGGEGTGFNDWAEANPDRVEANRETPEQLYQEYLTDLGYTWEEGGLVGLGKGILQQGITDPTLLPSLIGGVALGKAGATLASRGMMGAARGVNISEKALQTGLGGPEDILIDKGLGVLGKVLPDSIRSIFEPGEEGRRLIGAQQHREMAEGLAIDREAAGRINQSAPLSGTANLTGVPTTPTTAPVSGTVAPNPPNAASSQGLGTPFGARAANPNAPRGTASASTWDFDPVDRVWKRDGRLPTIKDLEEVREELLNTPPNVIDGFEEAELLGRMQTDLRHKTLVKMRAALTQGDVQLNGTRSPYMVDDWNPGRRNITPGTTTATRRAAGWRHIRYLESRIRKYGEAEIASQLKKLNRTKYRGRYGNTQPVEIWYDNMRQHLATAIKRAEYDGPVNLGVLHKNVNGQWVPGRQLTVNPKGTGKPLNIDDFEPDMGMWQALQASAHNNLRVMSPPPQRTPSPAQQVAPLATPTPQAQAAVQGAAQRVNTVTPPVNMVQTPPPTQTRWKLPFSRPTSARTARNLEDLSDEFDGLAPPDGHIPFLRRMVNGKTWFRTITDDQDDIYRMLDIIQGRQAGTPDELDKLLKTYEGFYRKLYGKEAVPDFQNMRTHEANAFTADVATQRWLDSLPPLQTSKPGLLSGVKAVSSDIASFRSGIGLHNWAAAPRQFVVQHTGNVFALSLTKPAALTKMFNVRSLLAFEKAAREARKGLKPGQRVRTSSTEVYEKLNLPTSAMIHDQAKSGTTGNSREMRSALSGPLTKAKRILAPEWLGDMVAIPDGMFRDGIASTTFMPAVRRFQKNYHKDAGKLAQDWLNARQAKAGFSVPPGELSKVVRKALDSRWDKSARISTLNQIELEQAIVDAFKHLPNPDLTRRFANRVARDYKTKLNNEYQAAAKEAKRIAFPWDYTRADDAIRHVFLYHYWMSRASALYTRELLKNPWMAANFARFAQALNEEAEQMEYPHWMQGFSRLAASPAGSILLANPTNLMGTMLHFAEWQYGEDLTQFGKDLTMLGRARGLWPGFFNPLWDGLLWEFGLYGGESARAPQDPTGAERIFRDGARIINLANLNGHLPDGWFRDELGNPIMLSEKPIQELAIKFYTAVGGIVRENPQPIPNLYASQQSQTKSYLLQDLMEDHPDWTSEQIERTANVIADQAALGEDIPEEWFAAEQRRVMADMQGPEYDFLPEPIKGLVGGVIRAISPVTILNRPELDMGMRNPPIGALGRDPAALPEFPDSYDGQQFRSQIYSTNELNNFEALTEDWWGDSGLTEAGKKRTAILNATNPDGETVNGVHFSQEQIMSMTDTRRFALAKEALQELGYTQADLDAQYAMREALEAEHPELRAYKGYIDAAESHPDGIEGFVDDLYATSPAFKRAMDNLPYPKGTPEWYGAFDWEETFLAATGTRTSLYDPLTPPEGIDTDEYADAREASQAARQEDSFMAQRNRSVNEAILAQRLLNQEYPGYGYRVGSGNLPSDVWRHMKDVWGESGIDTSFITKTSHWGAGYINWFEANPNAEDTSYQAYLDATMTDDGSNKFADGTATVEGEAPSQEFTLDGPINMTALLETFNLSPAKPPVSAQIVFPNAEVDLRTSPNGTKITPLPPRTALRLLERNGQWALVSAPGGFEGWVPVSALRVA